MISLEKWIKLTRLQKLPNNVGNLGKMIVATGFELLPKVQKIAQSGHTDGETIYLDCISENRFETFGRLRRARANRMSPKTFGRKGAHRFHLLSQ